MTLTPVQLRGGRELVGWSRVKPAARVDVCDETIHRYQRGECVAATLNLLNVRQTLEAAGIEFIAENREGSGVRRRKSKPKFLSADE
jgi:hypothetical protein